MNDYRSSQGFIKLTNSLFRFTLQDVTSTEMLKNPIFLFQKIILVP